MDTQRNKSSDGKKQYSKPRLRVIALATDEVLATACKISTGGVNGPGNTPCFVGQPTAPCTALGS